MRMRTATQEILVDDDGLPVGYVHKGQFYATRDSNNYWGRTGGWHICTGCNWSGYAGTNDECSGYECFCPECGTPFWDEKKSSKWVEKNPWDNPEIDIDKKWKPKDWDYRPDDEFEEEAKQRAREIQKAIEDAKREIAEDAKRKADEEAKEVNKRKAVEAKKKAALKKKKRLAREKKAAAAKPLPSVPSVTGEHARKINWN